ncbi:MAG: DUF1549 domain-containing protein [Planctomycetia bacterium]|nr:DUF1549 domain-containing protein [Planctomycetia bacterium]
MASWRWRLCSLRGVVCCTLIVAPGPARAAEPVPGATAPDAAPAGPPPALPAVAFGTDVSAVLAKGGCNAGTCHGNLHGKGGFFLSLRGQDAEADWHEMVESTAGRRINRLEPDRSLILLKATAAVPHGGGRRFGTDAPEYALLREWIAGGAAAPGAEATQLTGLSVEPADAVLDGQRGTVPLCVTARFGDGRTVDVTRMAVYEPSDPLVGVSVDGVVTMPRPAQVTVAVRYLTRQAVARVALVPARTAFTWTGPQPVNLVDEEIFSRLRQLGVNPAPPADDLVFVRRAFLDLLGVLPTPDEARAFAADPATDKRERLVDTLLARPEWAVQWAGVWADLLRTEEKTLDAKGVAVFHEWMRQAFADNVPLDRFVRGIIAARGSTYDVPPANFWRAHREPQLRAETVAQVFLGVRLQCAKCHNHPFDRWLQDEYHDWSAVFTGIDYEVVANDRQDKLDSHEFVGEQKVLVKEPEELKNPRTKSPARQRWLGEEPTPGADRLEALAAWMTDPGNRRFARAQVNRIWFHVMGRGLVEPVDDLRDTNPASHPALLERLTDTFVASGHDVRALVRLLCTSRVYGLSSRAGSGDFAAEEALFARAIVRRRSAERILDAHAQVLGAAARFEGYPAGTRAGEVAGVERVRRQVAEGDRFLRLFGRPERLLACECERSNTPTLSQALDLVGGSGLHGRLADGDNRIARLIAADRSPEQIVDELFWTALVRPPTADERAAAVEAFTAAEQPRLAAEDLAWALLNAKELLFRN